MKSFPYLERNLETLAQMRHPVGKWLNDAQVNLNVLASRLFTAPTGVLDFRMSEGTLLNGNSPDMYYQNWVPETDDKSATVIVGSSLGHGVNLFLSQTPMHHKVLVLEPRPTMLTAMLGLSDYSQQLRAGRLHFLLPEEPYLDEVLKRLSLQFLYGEIHFRADPASKGLGQDYLDWTALFLDKLERFSAGQNTIHLQQEVMIENELSNFKRALSGGSLSQLKRSATDVTALVLGAGPSLEQVGPALMDKQSNALVVCALQTLPSALKLGISPHMCVAIDYTPSMLDILPNLDMEQAKDIPLIYSTKVQPDLVEAYPGPTLPMWTFGGIGTTILNGKEPIIDVGTNVGVTCRRLLHWLGCQRMIYAGLDLAWIEGKTHSPGHHAARNAIAMNPEITKTTKGMHDEPLVTSVHYHIARQELEEDITNGGPETINIHSGGVAINGIPNITIDEALNQDILDSSPDALLSFLAKIRQAAAYHRNFTYFPQEERWQRRVTALRRKLRLAFRDLASNQTVARNTLRQTARLLGKSPMFAPYFHKEIHELAEYTHARGALKPSDLPEIEGIFGWIMEKIQFADSVLADS